MVGSAAKLQLVQFSPKVTILSQIDSYRKKNKKDKKKSEGGPATILRVSPDDESILQVSKKGKLTVQTLSEDNTKTVWTMDNAH